jgi:hypothetical protein
MRFALCSLLVPVHYIIITHANSIKNLAKACYLCYLLHSLFQEAAMRMLAILAVGGLLLVAADARADFYKWVDGNGKEYYTNDKSKVPYQYRDRATSVEMHDERVSVGDKPTGKAATAGKEHKDKQGRGEEYWRKKAAKLQLKLRDQQEDYHLVLKQLEDEDRKPKKPGAKKKRSHSALEKKKTKLEKDMARTRRMLEVDLPEEARKADAYPGWIRE